MQRQFSFSLSRLLFEHPFHWSLTTPPSILSKSIATITSSEAISASSANIAVSSKSIWGICHFCLSRSSSVASSLYPGARRLLRNYGGEASGELDVNKVVDDINIKFAEAREEIEAAMESKETVYFNEEAEIARVAVKEVLDMFEGLLGKVEERERVSLQRSMGLKIEQLKAELQQLNE